MVEQNDGQVIEIFVDDLGHKGEGVGRLRGKTVFVQGALPGDTVLARPFEVRKRFLRARLEKVVAPSPQRLESSKCSSFPACGGCQLQHMSYAGQVEWKEDRVVQVLGRVGGIAQPPVQPIVRAPETWHYRNKAQFAVDVVAGVPRLGFYEQYTHQLVPAENCHIQHPLINKAASSLARHIHRLDIAPFAESDGTGILRHVLCRASFSHDEVLVTLVVATAEFAEKAALAEALKEDVPELVGVTLNENSQRGNRILGDRNSVVWGRGYLREALQIDDLEIEYHVSAPSFFQTNPWQAQKLYAIVMDYAEPTPQDRVLDAYCGTGGITLVLATAGVREVWGIDIVEQAITDARENARINGVENAFFFAGRVEEIAGQLIQRRGVPNVLVVDPPRSGLGPAFLAWAAELEVDRWVYVSCNPVTLARDIKLLQPYGYNLDRVQPVDMFPHTAHIECVALLNFMKKRSGSAVHPR